MSLEKFWCILCTRNKMKTEIYLKETFQHTVQVVESRKHQKILCRLHIGETKHLGEVYKKVMEFYKSEAITLCI